MPARDDAKRSGMMREVLQEFMSNSTLHGLRYISDEERSRFEKVFWGVITVLSVCMCVWACSRTWLKWQDTPIIISVNDHLMAATEVPFPAVTICPQTKQKSFNFTEQYIKTLKYFKDIPRDLWRKDKEEARKLLNRYREQNPTAKQLAATYLVCEDPTSNPHFCLFPDDDPDFVQHIVAEAPAIQELVIQARFRQEQPKKLNGTFSPVLTATGLCYTFNSLAADEIFNMENIQKDYPYLRASTPSRNWSPDRGYFNIDRDHRERNLPIEVLYPRRGEERILNKPDFFLMLGDPYPHDVVCSRTSFKGYKVSLHHPAELPQVTHNFYPAEASHRTSIRIKVNVVTTSESLVHYPPDVRQCYFSNEKALKYFKVYTPNNCQLECLTNYTLENCGCVLFHMPRNDSTPVCSSVRDILCVAHASENFGTSDHWVGINGCQCLPACHSVEYDAEIIKTIYNLKSLRETTRKVVKEFYETDETLPNKDKQKDEVHKQYAEIEMYFKQSRLVTLRRSELFGSTDFLANCGGLLGLFLGFSILSLVELFYFLTLRLFYLFRRQNKTDDQQNGITVAHTSIQDVNAQTLATQL